MNIHPGDKVNFEVTEQGQITIKRSDASIMDREGKLSKYAKEERVDIDEMNRAIKEAAAIRYKNES